MQTQNFLADFRPIKLEANQFSEVIGRYEYGVNSIRTVFFGHLDMLDKLQCFN